MADPLDSFEIDDYKEQNLQKSPETEKNGVLPEEKIREEVRRMTVTKLHRKSIGNAGFNAEKQSVPPRNLSVIRYIEEDDSQKCCACTIF